MDPIAFFYSQIRALLQNVTDWVVISFLFASLFELFNAAALNYEALWGLRVPTCVKEMK